jgi:heme oxygenase (biliverdin-producing, ferredoxin)
MTASAAKTAMTTRPAAPLSARVRELTQADHHAAEHSAFMADLLDGRLSGRDYALLLAQYSYLYGQLERSVARWREAPGTPGPVGAALADLFDPLLDRAPSIRRDLARLLPAVELQQVPAPVPATRAYLQRLVEVERDGARLAAHHYLRYLGDLSGGQAVGRLVSRHYGLAADQLSMYRFEGIGRPKDYKDAYRRKLDALGFSPTQEDAFIDEASRGFRLHREVFRELERPAPAEDTGDPAAR